MINFLNQHINSLIPHLVPRLVPKAGPPPDVRLLFDVASLRMRCMAVMSDTGFVVVVIHVTRIETDSAKKGAIWMLIE